MWLKGVFYGFGLLTGCFLRVIIKYYGKVYLSERGKSVNERK